MTATTLRQRKVQCLSPAGLRHVAYVEYRATRALQSEGGRLRSRPHPLRARFRLPGSGAGRRLPRGVPGVVGRGRSDWLANKSLYGVLQYAADIVTLLARLDVDGVDWVGTSMGNLIGMALAARRHAPIGRLLLVDVGPVVTAESIARIDEYVGKGPRFDSVEQAEAYVHLVAAPSVRSPTPSGGTIAEHSVGPAADGKLDLHYDPGIAEPSAPPWAKARTTNCGQSMTSLPHARPARRDFRCPESRDGAGDGSTRTTSAGGRNRRRRTRADADGRRPGCTRSDVPPGSLKPGSFMTLPLGYFIHSISQ
ncbi:MAG: alpha/beta hydrolase [Burkholderiales bacterium]